MIGNVAAMASLLGYGASTTYTAAVLLRFLPSLLVGAPVAIKAALGDACDQQGQAKAMVIFTLGWGIGTILGKACKHKNGISRHECMVQAFFSASIIMAG